MIKYLIAITLLAAGVANATVRTSELAVLASDDEGRVFVIGYVQAVLDVMTISKNVCLPAGVTAIDKKVIAEIFEATLVGTASKIDEASHAIFYAASARWPCKK